MDALQLTSLERPLLWPVLTRPSLAAFEVSTEDLFDIQFEGDGEPGDDPKAPYHRKHQWASRLERMFAAELGVDWGKYETNTM